MKPAFYEMESNVKIRGLRNDRDKIEKQHRKSSRFGFFLPISEAPPFISVCVCVCVCV